jgi:2'-5' RNA ligase
VEINEPTIVNQIQQLISELGGMSGVRPVKSTHLHITLKFLGDIPVAKLPSIAEALNRIRLPRFNILLSGMGCFPNPNYIRVVWIGITQSKEQLIQLANQVRSQTTSLGFPKEKRSFSPHLTIARLKRVTNTTKEHVKTLIRQWEDTDFGVQYIDRFILKKSTLTPKGPIYENLNEVSLQ